MDTKLSLLKKIRLKTGKKLNTLFVGEYHSAFRGYGLSFDAVREYQYGDDFRSVDWNVSARMNHLYVKEYIEERELSVVLMVDVSGSTEFGGGTSKREVIMELATLLLNLAQVNHDRISVLLFSDRVEKFIKPRKGRKFILKVLQEILTCVPSSRNTDISGALDFVRRVMKKRSIIFVLSDFIDDRGDFMLKMKLMRRKHDVIPVQVSDPMEREMRIFGLTEFVDLETGRVFLNESLPEKWNFPELADFDHISLSTDEPIEIPILKFFEKRNRTKLTKAL